MEENKYYVYLHIKEENGEPFYVGKGKSTRYKQTSNRSKYWHNTVNKYGFDIIFLEVNLNQEEALNKEIYWIKRIGRKDLNEGPLVNLTDGGEGNPGKILSEETKEKMRQAKLGKKQSIETINKRVNKIIGKKQSIETINKRVNKIIGKKHKQHKPHILSKDGLNKIIEANKNRTNYENNGRKKLHYSVIQMHKNTDEVIKIWKSHHDAALELNCNPRKILDACYKKIKTSSGYNWKFFI